MRPHVAPAEPRDFQMGQRKSRYKASCRRKNRVTTAARKRHGIAWRRNGLGISKTRHGRLYGERIIGSSMVCSGTNDETLFFETRPCPNNHKQSLSSLLCNCFNPLLPQRRLRQKKLSFIGSPAFRLLAGRRLSVRQILQSRAVIFECVRQCRKTWRMRCRSIRRGSAI